MHQRGSCAKCKTKQPQRRLACGAHSEATRASVAAPQAALWLGAGMQGSSDPASFAGPASTFADRLYLQKEFGVTAAQALACGYPEHDAHAGVNAVAVRPASSRVTGCSIRRRRLTACVQARGTVRSHKGADNAYLRCRLILAPACGREQHSHALREVPSRRALSDDPIAGLTRAAN